MFGWRQTELDLFAVSALNVASCVTGKKHQFWSAPLEMSALFPHGYICSSHTLRGFTIQNLCQKIHLSVSPNPGIHSSSEWESPAKRLHPNSFPRVGLKKKWSLHVFTVYQTASVTHLCCTDFPSQACHSNAHLFSKKMKWKHFLCARTWWAVTQVSVLLPEAGRVLTLCS